MNREQLAEKIARMLNPGEWWDKDPHPADRAMWMDKGRAIADALWPVLAQVWAEGYRTAQDDADPMAPGTANPYAEATTR